MAVERARRQEEERLAAEEEGSQVRNPARNEFVVRSLEISHLDSGFRRAEDEVTQAVYRISQLHTISPAELVRETKQDPELEYVRQAQLTNQLGHLPEPYRSYRNSFFTRYGLVFQDDMVIISIGL